MQGAGGFVDRRVLLSLVLGLLSCHMGRMKPDAQGYHGDTRECVQGPPAVAG